ncbi:MAG TPA: tetratricopeptide repeat protein [Candidatus Eisenbacteria bacterium]|nr:tetratricopeptide repeat protein [Candidatus Eisenbacteria bacterium]
MSQPLFELYKDALRRGHLAVIDGRLDDALASYREAGAMAPDRALPYASIATVLHRLGRSDEAIAAFDRALELAPDDVATLRARWVALEEMGRVVETPFLAARAAAEVDVEVVPDGLTDTVLEATTLDERLGLIPGDDQGTSPPVDPRADVNLAPDGGTTARDRPPDAGAAQEVGFGPGFEAPGPYLPFEEGAEGEDAAMVTWPAIDLPSPPPPPLVGPPPDPRRLAEEAEVLADGGDLDGARELLLTVVEAHREAGQPDAALDACLQLLAMAPGDARAHLALAGLQLDQGWRAVATDKIALLLRLTALTGDTQAEADTHALAAERIRDEPVVEVAAG